MKIKNLKLKIIFFGSSKFVIPILEVLRKNFNLALVLTTENPKERKSNLALQGDALQSWPVVKWPVVKYCIENKIPYLSVQQFNNSTIQQLQKINAPIAMLADFGLIIPPTILSIFPKGIINIHPSLLPKYRGPTPVQTAILNGEKITGVSIIKIDEEIDHGPILGQEKEDILDTDTAESLYKKLFEKGANLLSKILNSYLKGDLKSIAQNHSKATFTKSLTRNDGFIDVSNLKTAVTKFDTMIRAYYPWPGVWTRLHLGGGRLSLRSHDSSEVKEKIIKFLPGNLIQVEGKKPMSYKDFFNGYPEIKQQLRELLEQL